MRIPVLGLLALNPLSPRGEVGEVQVHFHFAAVHHMMLADIRMELAESLGSP